MIDFVCSIQISGTQTTYTEINYIEGKEVDFNLIKPGLYLWQKGVDDNFKISTFIIYLNEFKEKLYFSKTNDKVETFGKDLDNTISIENYDYSLTSYKLKEMK